MSADAELATLPPNERGNWIAGTERPPRGSGRFVCRSPADRQPVARYPRSGAADVEEAVEVAQEVQPTWWGLPLATREQVLFEGARVVAARAPEIARLMATEMGKPLAESEAEVKRAASVLRFAAGELRRALGETFESDDRSTFLYTERRPLGVVGLITPWNFPIAIPAWKLAPALAYGNAVVVKPASAAPGPMIELARCLEEAGLPAGTLNVVTGSGEEAGEALCAAEGMAAISCTGSDAVGARVRAIAAGAGKRVQLELGGQNPAVVCADADLDQAAAAITLGAFGGAGQKCTATRRAIVERPVAERLRMMLVERAQALRVGLPMAADTEVSTLIDEPALQRFQQAIEQAGEEGGELICGGERIGGPEFDRGHYVRPAIVDRVHPGTLLAREEIFAPLLGIIEVDGLDEALNLANGVRHGLSAAVFTRDLARVRSFTRRIEAGVVHVNSPTAGADVHVPFGGTKASGYGPREQGRAARELFTESFTVYETPPGG